jgi:hypothetical protein
MKLIGICLLFICLNTSAKSQTLRDWIGYFKQNNIQIIYSSDFLKEYDLNRLLDTGESLSDFNQALRTLALNLVEVDQFTYVINPLEKINNPTTGLIIKLLDSENNPLTTFSINEVVTTTGLIVLDNLQSDSMQLTLSAQAYKPLNQKVMLTQDKYKSMNFTLEPKPVSIDYIIVTASQINFQSPNASKKHC